MPRNRGHQTFPARTGSESRKPGEKYRRVSSESGGSEFESLSPMLRYGSDTMSTDMEMDDSDKLNLIMERLNKLDVLEMINQRLLNIEENVNSMSKRLGDLEQSKEFIATEMDKKVNNSDFDKLVAQVDDMANRMRRNNVVLFSVPQKAEGDEEGN